MNTIPLLPRPTPSTGARVGQFFIVLLLGLASGLHGATSVSQYGITWTFSADHQVGQYANGDYWVVGPITITNITPASVVVESRPVDGGGTVSNSVINGSMINPIAGAQDPGNALQPLKQGFDSALASSAGTTWTASLNVARPGGNDLSVANPLNVPTGSSLVSVISHPTAAKRPGLTDAAVLTIVASPPPANSFRPPYAGTDKSLAKTVADLDFDLLLKLPSVSGAPTFAAVEPNFQRPWLEIDTSHNGWFYHPTNNQGSSGYGRDLAFMLGDAMLLLHLNFTNAEKTTLYTRLVQYGIDVYGAAKSGGVWEANGGHNHGRKMPMVLAARALNHAEMLTYSDAAQHFVFQEDQQTFIVSEADVGRVMVDETSIGRVHETYISADLGLAEWGEKHTGSPQRDGRNWNAFYRDQVGGPMLAHILTARLTAGAVSAWNWAPLMDYMERHYSTETSLYGFGDANTGAHYPLFFKNMWSSYRAVADGPVSAPSGLGATP